VYCDSIFAYFLIVLTIFFFILFFNTNRVEIKEKAIVCKEQTVIKGKVTIGSKTIIHPTATIIAENGPIVIGESNLIEECVKIINKSKETMTIGSNNVFEVGAYSESLSIGNNNILEYKCRLGPKFILTHGCVIGTKCCLNQDETLEERTVIFGTDCKRRRQSERPFPQTLQLDFLNKVMPNYQRIEKPNKKVIKSQE